MATLAALPLIALLLFVLFPNKGLGSYAFTHELGPVQEEEESERKFYLRQAKWWFLASLIFPGSLALAYIFEKNIPFVIICVFAGFLIGVPCFLKGLGSLYDAVKAKS